MVRARVSVRGAHQPLQHAKLVLRARAGLPLAQAAALAALEREGGRERVMGDARTPTASCRPGTQLARGARSLGRTAVPRRRRRAGGR